MITNKVVMRRKYNDGWLYRHEPEKRMHVDDPIYTMCKHEVGATTYWTISGHYGDWRGSQTWLFTDAKEALTVFRLFVGNVN